VETKREGFLLRELQEKLQAGIYGPESTYREGGFPKEEGAADSNGFDSIGDPCGHPLTVFS